MAEVKLLKQRKPYLKDGEKKIAVNLFLRCGDAMVPIEVKYFPSKQTGRDDRYFERKTLVQAFAESLPDKQPGNKTPDEAVAEQQETPDEAVANQAADTALPY